MPGVVVLPITASGEVLILRQYRYPVRGARSIPSPTSMAKGSRQCKST